MQEFAAFASASGDNELSNALGHVQIVQLVPDGSSPDRDIEVATYECLTDFLIEALPCDSEFDLLREALYSMANDYLLMAYVLCPALDTGADISGLSGAYFEMWRRGVGIDFFDGGVAAIRPFHPLES